MSTFDAIMLIETDEDADEDTLLDAWRLLIQDGIVWQLQGWWGRRARDLIQAGIFGEVC
jgi:hypothetical protein